MRIYEPAQTLKNQAKMHKKDLLKFREEVQERFQHEKKHFRKLSQDLMNVVVLSAGASQVAGGSTTTGSCDVHIAHKSVSGSTWENVSIAYICIYMYVRMRVCMYVYCVFI